MSIASLTARATSTQPLDTAPPPTAGPAPSPGTATASSGDAGLNDHYGRLPTGLSPAAASFVRAQGSASAEVHQKLNALHARYSGPFQVDGQSVSAAPMFRMNGGYNADTVKQNEKTLRALCGKAGLGGVVGMCLAGRATPAQLVKVTQLLIDEGHLPGGDAPLAQQIRQMQWKFGLGLDCVGYTWQAVQDVHQGRGKAALPDAQRANSLPRRLHEQFVKKPAEQARPGDVINLVATNPKEPGHNVIVRDNQTLDGVRQRELSAKSPAARAWLLDAGPIQVIDVDSSWGAGPSGASYGGVRCDTWLYNARTKEWADFDPESGAFRTSKIGPQGERPTGAYRPRGAA